MFKLIIEAQVVEQAEQPPKLDLRRIVVVAEDWAGESCLPGPDEAPADSDDADAPDWGWECCVA